MRNHDDEHKLNTTCSRIVNEPATEPIFSTWTFQHLMTVIGGACGALTIVICLGLLIMHITHQMNHKEQKLMMRVIALPITWSILAWVGIVSYHAAPFVDPVPLFQEAVAIAALFELFVTYIVPERSEREAFFMHADKLDKNGMKIDDGGSLDWFHHLYLRVYQLPLLFVLFTIVNEGLAVDDCPDNKIYQIVKVAVQVISGISTTTCVLAVFAFVRRFKHELKPRDAFLKLICFKGVVALTVLQSTVISILDKAGAIKSTTTASSSDYTIGLLNFMITIEMFIAAIGFIFAFNHLPYTKNRMNHAIPPPNSPGSIKKINTLRFALEGLYFPELFVGFYEAFKILGHLGSPSGKPQYSQAWQGEQRRDHHQRDPAYARLVDGNPREFSIERSPEEINYELPKYSESPNLHPQAAQTGHLPQRHKNHGQQVEPRLTPSMPQHTQAPQHLPQTTSPLPYCSEPQPPHYPYEPYGKGQ